MPQISFLKNPPITKHPPLLYIPHYYTLPTTIQRFAAYCERFADRQESFPDRQESFAAHQERVAGGQVSFAAHQVSFAAKNKRYIGISR